MKDMTSWEHGTRELSASEYDFAPCRCEDLLQVRIRLTPKQC
jgi:hypothetical protein